MANIVEVTGSPEPPVGVIVSILNVVCVIVMGCVAVAVTVTVLVAPLLPGAGDVIVEPPSDTPVGLKTPVVAVKELFVLLELSG